MGFLEKPFPPETLSIRPKLTLNSITNRATILPSNFDLLAVTNNIMWELVYGGTLGGTPSWTSAGSASVVEYDTAGTTLTGGEVVDSGFLLASTNKISGSDLSDVFFSKLPIGLDAAGSAQQTLSIVATPFTGSATVNAALTWRELYN